MGKGGWRQSPKMNERYIMGLIPLKEYAAKVGRSPRTIRGRIQRGATKGVKMGRDWFVEENEELTDGRVTEGRYEDWRKRHPKRQKAQQVDPAERPE